MPPETEQSTESSPESARAVLITGAAGYVGRLLTAALARERRSVATIVAADIRELPVTSRLPGVVHALLDVQSEKLVAVLREHRIDTVVHLAATLNPAPQGTQGGQLDADVAGMQNLLAASVAAKVRKVIVLSSGAAYGYHPDSSPCLDERDPLRGNDDFPYARSKRLVEEALARYRADHPELAQLVLRAGTILGSTTANLITRLFERPFVLGVKGSAAPFTFTWDEDVVAAVLLGVFSARTGIYNLVGDGVMTLREIARCMGKPYLSVPPRLLARVLAVLRRLRLSQVGPEQLKFLQYRPVMSNDRLKRELGFTPRCTSRAAFGVYRRGRGAFSGRTVVITGAAGGLGRALAQEFAEAGGQIAIIDRDGPGVEALAMDLAARQVRARPYTCDVTDAERVRRTFAEIATDFGGVDVLVNNAGISHRSLVEQTRAEVIRKVMEVNFFGAVYCTQAALPFLRQARGRIVVISSIAGFAPLVGRAGYAASKHALHGFFDSLRAELCGSGIGVHLVCPGFTDTPIDTAALGGDGNPVARPRVIIGAMARPQDVAVAIVQQAARRRDRLVLSRMGKASYWLNRVWPAAYARCMRRGVGSEFFGA
ncbi:MAG: SDR family oxidoreductase [Candidatus Schekmanbacteria bacterium]|nr:SDR family oxidoreductase [Candidatus Schekmanbacteria bacterium]